MVERQQKLSERDQTDVDRERTRAFINVLPETWDVYSNEDPDELFWVIPSYEIRLTFLGGKYVDVAFWEDPSLPSMGKSFHSVGKSLQPNSISLAHTLRKICLFVTRDLGCTITAEPSDLRRFLAYEALSRRYDIPVELILSPRNQKKLDVKERYGRRK